MRCSVAGSITAIPYGTTVLSIDSDTQITMSANALISSDPTDTIAFTNTTVPGNPVVVFPSGGPAQPTVDGALYMYPNPQTPTSSRIGRLCRMTLSRVTWLAGLTSISAPVAPRRLMRSSWFIGVTVL